LARAGYFERVETDMPGAFLDVLGRVNPDNETEPLTGWELTLIVAPDRNSYSVELREIRGICPVSLFSDQSGLVHESKAKDCAKGR
jgi:hypothetical protein